MWPDRVSNPGPLTYESGAVPTALRGQALKDATGMATSVDPEQTAPPGAV